jgi:hypothetical protein
MRLTLIGLLAATAALCAACSPAIGSKEWCEGVMKGSIQPNPQDQAQMEGAMKCAMGALDGAFKNLGQ